MFSCHLVRWFMTLISCNMVRCFLLLLCFQSVIISAESVTECDYDKVHTQENRCNKYLGEIGTAILASDGLNYTHVCK